MLTLPTVTAVQLWRAGGRTPVCRRSSSARTMTTTPAPLPSRRRSHVDTDGRAARSRHAGADRSRDCLRSRSIRARALAADARASPGCAASSLLVAAADERMAVGAADEITRRRRRQPTAWQHIAARLSRRLHIARHVRLLESTLVDVPTVIGWIKPVVLLPASALAGLSPQQLEAILAHELAHIRRHDYLVNLLQTLVETLLFYHPAVWWLSRRIRVGAGELLRRSRGEPVRRSVYLRQGAGRSRRAARRARPQRLAMAASGGSLVAARAPAARRADARRASAGLARRRAPRFSSCSASRRAPLGPTRSSRRSQPRRPRRTRHRRALRRRRCPEEVVAITEALEDGRQGDGQRAQIQLGRRWCTARAAAHAHGLEGAADAGPDAVIARPTPRRWRMPSPRCSPATHRAGRRAAGSAARDGRADAVGARGGAGRRQARRSSPSTRRRPSWRGRRTRCRPRRSPRSAPAVSAAVDGRQSSGNYSWSNNGEKLEVNYDGEIEFTDDDMDVKALSPGGSLRIRDGGWICRPTRSKFTADASGNLTRRFWVGATETAVRSGRPQWLAKMLPRFIRQTGDRRARRASPGSSSHEAPPACWPRSR